MPSKTCSLLAVALAVVAWVALTDAALLVQISAGGSELCGPGSGCDAVVHGRYGTFLGVPLSYAGFGLAAFMVLLSTIILAAPSKQASLSSRVLWTTSGVAALVSIYLQYVQIALIHATCPYCVTFAVAMFIVFGLSGTVAHRLGRGEAIELRGAPAATLAGAPPALTLALMGFVMAPSSFSSPDRSLLVIGGRTFTEDDWQRETPGADDAQFQVYDLESEWADRKTLEIATEIEARRRGTTVAAIESELSSLPATPSAAPGSPESTSGGTPLTPIFDSPRAALVHARQVALGASFSKLAVRKLFSIPFPSSIELDLSGVRGQQGPAYAPVTVIQASDFTCPFCVKAGHYLEDLRAKFGDDVRIAYMHNPIPGHRNAVPAAAAAECAGELGHFWEYHRRLIDGSPRLELDDLARYAADVGLDQGAFRKMLESGHGQPEVARQKAELARHHVLGAPMFFVNRRVLGGSWQPLLSAVEEELRARRR